MNSKNSNLTSYETHKLIKADVPDAVTVYEREHKGQMTIDEWLDVVNDRRPYGTQNNSY